ncbi:MAG: DnaJ domain-containing protein [Treponemataceae bacterium]
MSNLYDDLGVSKTASSQEIKKAYRDGAFKYHPDRNQGNVLAEEKFKKISSAYSVLGDDIKRKQYDTFGDAENSPFSNASNWNTQENADFDPFEDFLRRNAQSRKQHTYTYYGSFSGNNRKEENYSKKDFFFLLLKNLFVVGMAIYFLGFALRLGILGFFIIVPVFVNGVTGSIRALQGLFNVRGK